MLNKKLLTILILIAVIFSVSAASAMDAGNGTLEVSDDAIDVDDSISSLNNDIYDDYLKANISDFDDLSDKVNGTEDGETLYLESDYRTTNSSNQIIISKSITIDGQNHVIEAPDVKRVFLIEANDVCIRNINFINSKATGLAGGVISWLGDNGTLENCNFTNNSASSGGGAVCWTGDFGRISNCSFQSNDVKFGPAVGLTCQDSFDPHMIHIQIVNSEGGALYIGGNDVSVDFCRFYNNVALLNGGAISVNWGNNVSISNSKFRNNTAGYNGGAIDFNGNNASLANLKFIRNSPKDLFLNSINATVANTSFKDESAVESWYDVNYVNVTYGIGDFEILSDEIYMTPEGGILVLDRDYEFVNGSAEGIVISKSITIDGAGHTLNGNKLSRIFNVTADNVTIKNVNFINGDSRGSYSICYGGGAILWNGNDGCVENCSFADNCEYSVDIEALRQEIVVCDEGVMHIEYYYISIAGATTSQGGAIAWIGDNGRVENSTFRHNCVGYANDGGAIYWAGANGKIINSEFYDNDAYRGAALHWSGVNGTVSLSTFINSGICDDGIFWTGQNGIIKNSILLSELGLNCVISQYADDVKADFNFWGDTLDSPNRSIKSANVNHWVLMDYAASTDFVFEGDSFAVNYKFDTVTDKSSNKYSFSGMASKAGSVTFTSNETGMLNVSYGKYNVTEIFNGSYGRNDFTFNVIPYNSTGDFYDLLIKIHDTPEGGVLVLDRDYDFTSGFNKGILISKSITIDGAGHTLNGNKSSRIFNITADNVTIRNVNFKNGNALGRFFSKVDIGGGAIFWSGDNGYLFNCSFVNNHGSGLEENPYDGTEVMIDDEGSVWFISRMMPMGAKTNEGGAIVWKGDNGTVDKCFFKDNGLGYPNAGGAICWRGDSGKVISSDFISNDAWSGSSICWIGENGYIVSSTFQDSIFSSIMWYAKTGNISNSILLDSQRNALFVYDGNVTADYNWWGDTLNNTNMVLKATSINEWLVLNLSADKSIVYAGDEITINLSLNQAVNSSGVVRQYMSNLLNANLYLDNGDIVKLVNGTSNYKFKAATTGVFEGIKIADGKIHFNIKSLSQIKSGDLTKYYKSSKQFKVQVFGDDGKVVKGKIVNFTINKKVYHARTDENGYATLNINLKPGKYAITTQYGRVKVKNSIVVKSTLITKDVSKKAKSSAKFYVKVVKTDGKAYAKRTVQVKFLGKTYKIVTNAKGMAGFAIPKNLKVGKYAIKSTFNGITNTNKIIVKK